MNIFRLVLCLAGLLTFLAVRHFSAPPAGVPAAPPDGAPAASISLGKLSTASVPATPALLESNGMPSGKAAPVTFVLSPTGRGVFEANGRIVVVKQGSTGLLYSVNSGNGQALITDLSEGEFRQRDPELFAWVTQPHVPPKLNPLLTLQVRSDANVTASGKFK